MFMPARVAKNLIRTMSSSFASSFKDVKAATRNPEITIIDVREKDEIKESGSIPNSVNIPLGILERVFKDYNNEDFKATFGKSKPGFEDHIITSCRSGKRSCMSQHILQDLGYKRVYNYTGGWLDWAENNDLKTT